MWESQWRRVNVISYVGWSFLLLGNEERECVLCHVGWLCPAARRRWRGKRVCVLSCWLPLPCCWPVGKREEGEKWSARPFMLPRGDDPGRMASVILIGWKYVTTITVKLIYAPNINTKFFLLHIPKVSDSYLCEFEGLLVGEWDSVLLSRYLVFPTSSRKAVGLSNPSGHCWMRKSLNHYFWVSYAYSVARRCHPRLLKNSHISQIRHWNVLVVFGGW